MIDVAVIGSGVMGSAFVRVLLRAKYSVTVWNRTQSKAELLVQEGATLAPDLAYAVASSPLILIILDSYQTSRDLFSKADVKSHLPGRVVVQLGTGTPQEAREAERWAKGSGASYLDAACWAYADQIGQSDSVILISGSEMSFQNHESILRCLAGGLTYVGDKIGTASAIDCAQLSFTFGAFLGAIDGARICKNEGIPVDKFGAMMADQVITPVIRYGVLDIWKRIHEKRFDESEAPLSAFTAVNTRLLQQARDAAVEALFPDFLSEIFARAERADLGGQDVAALIQLMGVND